MNNLVIIAGNSNLPLATAVAQDLGTKLAAAKIGTFSDGETRVEIGESVRGKDVFVLQSTCPPVNNNVMELLVIIDALKRASVRRITAVLPYYGYARQDRKVEPRAPITAKLVADLITVAGAKRILSMDLHAGQIQGFFNLPVDHLFASDVVLDYLGATYRQGNLVVVSPDSGGVERANYFAKRLGAELAIIYKRRSGPNEAKVMNIVGDVVGRTAIVVDDIIDTAGTLIGATEALFQKGAAEVISVGTHADLSGPAIERINASRIREVVVTDTIPLAESGRKCPKIRVLSVHKLLAEAIRRIHNENSVSSLFNRE